MFNRLPSAESGTTVAWGIAMPAGRVKWDPCMQLHVLLVERCCGVSSMCRAESSDRQAMNNKTAKDALSDCLSSWQSV